MAKTENTNTSATATPASPAYVPASFWGQLPTCPAEVHGWLAHRKQAHEATGQLPKNFSSRIAQLLNRANKEAREAGRGPVCGDGVALTRYTVEAAIARCK